MMKGDSTGFNVKKKQNQCNFYKFSTKKSALENTSSPVVCEDLTSMEDFITDLLVYNEMQYFVFSTFFGNINVYKWMDFKSGSK